MTDSNVPERIQQKTVVAQVMERIKELIASGQYQVGDRIPTEQELAARFGIGRSSVREAIKIFQHLGVLESRVPKGTFVCDRANISSEAITWSILLGNNEMYEIIELREVVEERGFRALAEKFHRDRESVRETISKLEREVRLMREAAEEHSPEKMIQADYRFHDAIIRESGNSLFSSIYSTLHHFTLEEIRKTYGSMSDLMEVSVDHREIIDSVLNSRNALDAIERHHAHFHRIKRLLGRVE